MVQGAGSAVHALHRAAHLGYPMGGRRALANPSGLGAELIPVKQIGFCSQSNLEVCLVRGYCIKVEHVQNLWCVLYDTFFYKAKSH